MRPTRRRWWIAPCLVTMAAAVAIVGRRVGAAPADDVWHHRNLGKAFYENPTTHALAVDEFRKALDLAPGSARERVNYGLALLRAGRIDDGIAELDRAQRQDPSIPHTWFNLGIAYKNRGDFAAAVVQLQRMAALVPSDAATWFNLGYLHRQLGDLVTAIQELERAATLDRRLAGPHYELMNLFRQGGRDADAAREEQAFLAIKRGPAPAIPENLDWNAYAEVLDPIDPVRADEPLTPLAFGDRHLADGFSGGHAGVLVIDADGDGRPDVLAWSSRGIRLFRNSATAVRGSGLDGIAGIVAVAAGDYNNDGLPDLCVVTESAPLLFVNAGGTFRPAAVSLPQRRFDGATWVDIDHDYDLDLLLVGSSPAVMQNARNAFTDVTPTFPWVNGHATEAIVTNLGDVTLGHDIVVAYADRSGVVYRDQLGGTYDAQPMAWLPTGAHGLAAADVDGDGRMDLLFAGGPSAVVLNRVDGFSEAPHVPAAARSVAVVDAANRGTPDVLVDGDWIRRATGAFASSGPPLVRDLVAVAAADFDGDGRSDLAALTSDGVLHVMRNATSVPNRSARVRIVGIRNQKLAEHAEVEVKTADGYQKQAYAGVPLVFGVGRAASLDTVRITWPNGLIQNEMNQRVGPLVFNEAQRLSGSCPMIFTWNGRQFTFVTDVLGVAPLGASSGDGEFFPVDHDEWVQIRGDQLVANAGSLDVRITEELHEVSYLDELRLVAVDHPHAIEIFTNDKFKSPPFPEFRLFGGRTRIHPVRARDDRGHDVTAELQATDGRYPLFPRSATGVAAPHSLDVDFGAAAASNRAVLVLRGWVDWADGSTFRAESQAAASTPQFPSVQVKDASGRWQTVVDDMGIPAGKPKTIAVDLADRFLTTSREVRITTNLCVYWDEIFLIDDSAAPPVVLTPLELTRAELAFRGFSTPTIDPSREQPESFDYNRLRLLPPWNPTAGRYTRYGDVRPLVAGVDDEFVIMGSGDEIRLSFRAGVLPTLPAGWRRDFLLRVDGWAKDADPNTAFGQTVEPLPFHAMTAYPYPAPQAFPSDAEHQRYRERYNTRPALRLLRPLAWAETQSSIPY